MDDDRQRTDAASRPPSAELAQPESLQNEHAGLDHSGHAGHAGHAGMGHSGTDHSGHGDMDMAPDGIQLATGGPDRDGLEMDVLHLKLGPVLRHWPAGLVLRCTLQGDLIVKAEASTVGTTTPGPAVLSSMETALRRCDDLVALLFLAGSDNAARRIRRTRDQLMSLASREEIPTSDLEMVVTDFRTVRRRLRRSRILRWSLRGVGRAEQHGLEAASFPMDLQGDSYDRMLRLLDLIVDDLTFGAGVAPHPQQHADVGPDVVARLVTGLDLATARLVVASVGGLRITAGGAHEVTRA